jgi:hypothetical protein
MLGQMTDKDFATYGNLGRLFNDLAKEERLQAKEEAADLDSLSDDELIAELAPVFLKLGWTPPKE